MKASELIRQLADAISKDGDLDVVLPMPHIGFLEDYRVGPPQHFLNLEDFFGEGERIVIDYDTAELENFSDGDWLGSELDEGGPEVAGEITTPRGDGNDGYMAGATECDYIYECNCGGECQSVFDWLRAPPTQEAGVMEGPCDDDSFAAFLHDSSDWEEFDPHPEW
jgi:hypothetical protein